MPNDGWTYGGSDGNKICIRATLQDSVSSNVSVEVICWHNCSLAILGLSFAQFQERVTNGTIDTYLQSLNTDRIFKCKIIVQAKESDEYSATCIFAKLI